MTVYSGTYKGIVKIASSKSDSQRAILAAALADGVSVLRNVGKSADEQSMLLAIQKLGARFTSQDSTFTIIGTEKIPQNLIITIGESGLGVRLLSSLLLTQNGTYEIDGEGTLKTRPIAFFKTYFSDKIPAISDTNGFLPLRINGPYLGGDLTVSGAQSSQYISGLVMGLPLAKNDSQLFVEELNSEPYVQMTLDTVRAFGIQIDEQDLNYFIIPGNQKYLPTNYTIEGDWSSASYWLIASALGHKIAVEGLNMASLQADKAILKAFAAANCIVEHRENRIFVRGENRIPFTFDAKHSPDLFPTLAVLAALTPGKSSIYGLSRLENKESNRGRTVQSEFGKLGVEIVLDFENDAMHIHGKSTLHGGRVFSNHDHRIAMSLAILGLFAENPIQIDHPEAVKKSYPRFWDDLDTLKIKS